MTLKRLITLVASGMVATLIGINGHSANATPVEPDSAQIARADSILAKHLNEVTVTAKLIEHSGNTDIYQITGEIIKNSHTAGEILGYLPGCFTTRSTASSSIWARPE